MKKCMSILLALMIIFSFAIGSNVKTASANTSPTVMINGGKIVNNRTLVPLRAIFEELDATVQYKASDKTIIAKKGSTTVWLKVGSKKAKINNKAVTIDVPAQVFNGSTLVPLRFISDSFGVTTEWFADMEGALVTALTKRIFVNVGVYDSASVVSTLVIKKSPGANYREVATVPRGASVKVIDTVLYGYDQENWSNDDRYSWSKIKYGGVTGWVPTYYLVFVNLYSWAPGVESAVMKEIKSEYVVSKNDKTKLIWGDIYAGIGSLELHIQYNGVGDWYHLVSINPKMGAWR